MIVSAFSIGEESLRMRAVAKPTVTSTPPITSTNFTGRDYLRVQRTPMRNLHNRNGFCTGRRSVQREGKAPSVSSKLLKRRCFYSNSI